MLGALGVFLLLSYVSKRIGDQFVWPTWWMLELCSFFLCSVANFGNHTSAMVCILGAFVLHDSMFGEREAKPSDGRLLIAPGLLLPDPIPRLDPAHGLDRTGSATSKTN
ncbi:MAG TPA: hypothetical protein VH252_06750 [Chthoniobacterales bacterium]|nr:hypothetical protein [Chthoniobacterales bacterium]